MALKEKVKGILSFLDTEGLSDMEELDRPTVEEKVKQVPPVATKPELAVKKPVVAPQPQMKPQPQIKPKPQGQYQMSETNYQTNHTIHNRRQEMLQSKTETGRVVIALRYPKRYEDAQQIVDLLIENESVLIDFQYMMDAQARRCIDFIDGASKVLFGGLEKVGNTMYLLTPANVVVNIEDLSLPNQNQDISYNYDMKRR